MSSLSTGPIGFGLMGMTWRAKQTPDEQAFAAMKAAVNNGATFWSSADFYGTTDPLAGVKLVRRYFEKYPEDASKVKLFIKGCADPTTLAPLNDRAGVRGSVENCLRALGHHPRLLRDLHRRYYHIQSRPWQILEIY